VVRRKGRQLSEVLDEQGVFKHMALDAGLTYNIWADELEIMGAQTVQLCSWKKCKSSPSFQPLYGFTEASFNQILETGELPPAQKVDRCPEVRFYLFETIVYFQFV